MANYLMGRRLKDLLAAAQQLENAFNSPVDGRDLLAELRPFHWHHCDIDVRIDGQNRRYEGDWLKRVWQARQRVRALLASIDPDYRYVDDGPQKFPQSLAAAGAMDAKAEAPMTTRKVEADGI